MFMHPTKCSLATLVTGEGLRARTPMCGATFSHRRAVGQPLTHALAKPENHSLMGFTIFTFSILFIGRQMSTFK